MLALFLWAVVVAAAAADAVREEPQHDASRETDDETLSTKVRAKKPPRAPGAFTIDTAERRGAPPSGASGADLMKLVPGVFLSQHAGQGKAPQMFLRGFDAEHGQDIEVIVGGVPVNEVSNVHGQGYADATFVPAEVVRALRVREGSYDPRQGDFAIAGSVDFDLGLPAPGMIGRVSGGSFGLLRAFAGWRPHGADDRTFVAGEAVRGDGFGPGRAFERGSFVAQWGSGAALWLPGLNAAVSARVLAALSTARFGSAGVLRVEDIEAGLDRFSTLEADQGGQAGRQLALLELTLPLTSSRTRASGWWTHRTLRLRHNFTGKLLYNAGDTVSQGSDATTFGASLEHDHRVVVLGSTQHIVAGASVRRDAVESRQERLRADGSAHTREVDADVEVAHAGAWAELVLALVPGTRLHVGGRAEAVAFGIDDRLGPSREGERVTRAAWGGFVGPRVAADWRALPWLTLQAAYGEGFRTPQALALARGEVAPITRSRSGEVGIAAETGGAADRALTLALSGFITHVEQDRAFDHATATSLFIGPTLRAGVVAWFALRPTSLLTTTASATAVRAVRVEGGGEVPFAPPLVARVDNRVLVPLPIAVDTDAFAELGAGVVGARPLPFGDRARPVAVVDGAAGVRVQRATLSMEVFNLLDAEVNDGEFSYASAFSADDSRVPGRHVTAAPPRLVQLTLSVALP